MNMYTYYYKIVGNSTYYQIETDCDIEEEAMWLAESAAEEYYNETKHKDWPLTIALYETIGGPEMSRHKIDMEISAHFWRLSDNGEEDK